MTVREKILIAAMCCGVVYAGYTLLAPKEETVPEPLVFAQAEEISGDIRARLAEGSGQIAHEAILMRAEKDWTEDPFTDAKMQPVAVEKTPSFASGEALGLSYTGYLSIGRMQFAVIAGREYTLGDRVYETPFVVIEITARYVMLEGKEGQKIRLDRKREDAF